MGLFRRSKRRGNNVRARDGWVRRTSAERRRVRKYGGLSARQQRKVTSRNRRYNKAKLRRAKLF